MIADDARNDFKWVTKGRTEKRVFDAEAVSRAKLRVEMRLRHLKAGRPQKWGDSQTIISKSDEDNVSSWSDDELEKRLAEIERKETILHGLRGYGPVANPAPIVVGSAAPARRDLF